MTRQHCQAQSCVPKQYSAYLVVSKHAGIVSTKQRAWLTSWRHIFQDVPEDGACATQHEAMHLPLLPTSLQRHCCVRQVLQLAHKPHVPLGVVAPESEIWFVQGWLNWSQPDLLHSVSCLQSRLVWVSVIRLHTCKVTLL